MEKITDHQFLETLEPRIAPAGLFSFQDTDGDSVTVKLTGAGTVAGDHTGLTLSGTDPLKSALKITVKKGEFGDGLADIDGITGSGLKSLKAGTTDFTGTGIALTGALENVTAHDLLNGADIMAAGTMANRSIVVAGHLSAGSQIDLGSMLTSFTTFDTDGDKYTVSVKGTGGFQGDLADGLSLINTTHSSTLGIAVTKATTGSDGLVNLTAIDAGSGFTGLAAIKASHVNLTDHLILNTMVGKIALGGIQDASLVLGGTALDKAHFTAGHITNSDFTFGGSLSVFSATQFDSGSLSAAAIAHLNINGDAESGLAGDLGATVKAGSIGNATIAHDLTGSLRADTSLGTVIVGHDVIGGAARASGAILAGSSIESVTIAGNLTGGSGELSGNIFQYDGNVDADLVHTLINPGAHAAEQTSAITINGSVIGGTGDYSGGIMVHNVKALTIEGDLVGGDNTTAGDLRNTGFIYGTLIDTLTIGKSILAGNNLGGGTLENSGAINLRSYVGTLTVGGDITGSATENATLTSFGLVEQGANGPGIYGLAGTQLGFGTIKVSGNVTNANILAGVDGMGFDNLTVQTNNAIESGVPGSLAPSRVNAPVGIGAVTIMGNLTDSNIVAGYTPGTDGVFGTADDVVGTAIAVPVPYSQSLSSIASLTIYGPAGAVGSAMSSGLHGQITVATGASLPTVHDFPQLNIIFNYDYDTSGFFSDPLHRAILDDAAATFESRLPASDFSAISPGNGNTWTLDIADPSNPRISEIIKNPDMLAGTLVVYVGAHSASSDNLGTTYSVDYSNSTTSPSWNAVFTSRDTASTFRPVAGVISFNSNADFYFDPNPNTMEKFSGYDFYSIAIHELGHVLGFGLGEKAFTSKTKTTFAGNFFTGASSEALYGGPVPLSPGYADHWADGLLYKGQILSMEPYIDNGTREPFTELDWAALKDIGYHALTV